MRRGKTRTLADSMGLKKSDLQRLAIEQFGTDKVPVALRREARLLASRQGISPAQALGIVKANRRRALANAKAVNATVRAKLKRTTTFRAMRNFPQSKNKEETKSTWPDNPSKG